MLITYISKVTVNFQNSSLQQNSSAVLQVSFFFSSSVHMQCKSRLILLPM